MRITLVVCFSFFQASCSSPPEDSYEEEPVLVASITDMQYSLEELKRDIITVAKERNYEYAIREAGVPPGINGMLWSDKIMVRIIDTGFGMKIYYYCSNDIEETDCEREALEADDYILPTVGG